DAQGQSRPADRRDGSDPARALQERRAARGRVSDARDRARRHADAIVRRLARARPAMGPRVLRAVAVPWRTHGGGGIPLSAGCRAQEGDVTKAMFVIVAFIVVGVVSAAHSVADEAPISGTVKAIETSGKTLTLQTTAKGKTRDV